MSPPHARFKAINSAYRRGDLAAVLSALGDPPDFPNCLHPFDAGVGDRPLEYAIYHSPPAFIRTLLECGADPNYQSAGGFPALIAAISTKRDERHEIVAMLLSFGADLQQRGINDWTPLHYAVARRDVKGIEILLAHGADPDARTRIDDCTTALEDANAIGLGEAVRALLEGHPRAG
jgi:ankyrin repeat protein